MVHAGGGRKPVRKETGGGGGLELNLAMQGWLKSVCRWLGKSPAILVALALAGVALRVREALEPLTFDEAWVANSLHAATLGEALYYSRVPQSTPPLWLALNYVYAWIGHPGGELWLRILPLAGGVAMVALSAAYAGRVLGSRFRAPAAAMAAASGFMVVQSAQLKQYTTDAVMATLLLWGVTECLKAGEARRWSLLAAGCAVSMTLAYTQALMLPVVAAAMAVAAWRGTLSWAGAAARLGAIGGFGMAVWAAFIHPNAHPFLKVYWADQFPGSLAQAPEFFALRTLQWTRVLYRSSRYEELIWAVLMALMAAGAAALALRKRRNDGGLLVAGAFAMTLLSLAAASAARVYPMGPARLVLFSFPVLLGAWLAGVDAAARWVGARMGRSGAAAMMRAWPALLAVAMLALMARDLARPGGGRPEVVDTPKVVELLKRESRTGDTIWIHGSAVDVAEHYFRAMGRPEGEIVRSGYGLPCCVTERMTEKGVSYEREIVKEWETRTRGRMLGQVWLVSLEGALIPNGYDDAAGLREQLAKRGCEAEDTRRFRGVRVDRMDCRGRHGPGFLAVIKSKLTVLTSAERWLSGRKQRFAKPS